MKMLMKIALPKMGELLVMIIDDDFPLWEGSSPGGTAPPEGKSAPAQVPPRGRGVSSRKFAYDFFQSKRLHIA